MSSPEDPDDQELESSPSLPRKRKTKSRASSSSRLPIAASKSPPTVGVIQFDFDDQLGKSGKRRPTRRQSGLLTSVSITAVTADSLNRPPSPVPGSPVRDAMDEDELAAVEPDEDEVEAILQTVAKRERKSRKDRDSEQARDTESDVAVEPPRARERKKHRVAEDSENVVVGSKSKLKDVTNSQTSRSALPLLDTAPGMSITHGVLALSHVTLQPRSCASAYSGRRCTHIRHEPYEHVHAELPVHTRHHPSAFFETLVSSTDSALIEPRCAAVSVGTGAFCRRTGASCAQERQLCRAEAEHVSPDDTAVRCATTNATLPCRKMRKPDPVPPTGTTSKRSSSVSAPQDDPQPISSRSSSSNTADGDADLAPAGTTRRKKSRAYTPPDDEEESEGTQADAEFGSLRTGTWAHVEGRRRSVHGSSMRRVEGDDLRRHSMAV